jgi:hypothetical protein
VRSFCVAPKLASSALSSAAISASSLALMDEDVDGTVVLGGVELDEPGELVVDGVEGGLDTPGPMTWAALALQPLRTNAAPTRPARHALECRALIGPHPPKP